MTMLLKDLSDARNRHGHQPRKHRYEYEPDLDAPWNQRRELLPITARCETCAHWCRGLGGACGITLDLGLVEIKGAEDRCKCWSEHAGFEHKARTAWAGAEIKHDARSRSRRSTGDTSWWVG